MAQSVFAQFEAGALNALAAAIQANAPTLESLIASGELKVETAIADLLKQVPSVKGIAGIVGNPLEQATEAAINAYVKDFVAKESPATVVALLVSLVQGLAEKV